MAAMIQTTIPLFRQPQRKANSNSALFVDEDLAAIPAVRIPDEFRKLSRFLPVIVLVPKSAVGDEIGRKKAIAKKAVAGFQETREVPIPLDAAKAWFRNPSPGDNFAFGEITVSFSRMETERNGQPVALTCKQFKTMAYLIKNAGKVISRDELLNEVWGYQCYPCTRTVDNRILQLRRKLETEPARPKHFPTVHGTGYKFLPRVRARTIRESSVRETPFTNQGVTAARCDNRYAARPFSVEPSSAGDFSSGVPSYS